MKKEEIEMAKLPDLSQMTDEEIEEFASKIAAKIIESHKKIQDPES